MGQEGISTIVSPCEAGEHENKRRGDAEVYVGMGVKGGQGWKDCSPPESVAHHGRQEVMTLAVWVNWPRYIHNQGAERQDR